MKQKEKERFIKIYNKMLTAKEEEIEVEGCDFMASGKFKGVKLDMKEYEFFKPIIDAHWTAEYKIGKYESHISSSMFSSVVMDGKGHAYIAFPEDLRFECMCHMRIILRNLCIYPSKVKYADLLNDTVKKEIKNEEDIISTMHDLLDEGSI